MRTALAAVLAAAVLAGCSNGGGGGNTVNWYVFKEPGGSYDQAAATCSQQSNGRYHIKIVDLPTDADVQRQQLVRRLAAKDSSVDIVGMDVIWTGEFAEAGWIQPFPADKAGALSKGVLPGPLATGTYKNQLYAAPLTSNTQLLWYRKDRVPNPPATWDELIDQAIQLRQQTGQPNYVEVQANRYEGYTVWFNAMLAGAGGKIVETGANGEATASLEQAPTEKALAVMKRLATSPVADPSLSTSNEDSTRLAFQSGKATFMVNYPFVYPSAQKDAPDVAKNMAWAPYPATVAGHASAPPLGGLNLGIGSYSKHPDLAVDAVTCLTAVPNQVNYAIKGGLPPTAAAAYDDPGLRQAYPFGDEIRSSLVQAVPRPVTPAYNDVSLAVQRTLHPTRSINPVSTAKSLRDLVAKALKGEALL